MSSIPDGKVCTKCDTWLPLTEYSPHTRAKDGRASSCRRCHRKVNNAYHAKNKERAKAYRQSNKEIAKEYSREYRAKNKERIKAQRKAYRRANAEVLQQRDRERHLANPNPKRQRERVRHARNPQRKRDYERTWRVAHPDKWAAQMESWRARNAERIRSYQKTSKARRRSGTQGHFTAAEWRDLCAQHGNRCLRCGAEGSLSVDHVVPISRGGTNTIDNIQPLCLPCNLHKHATTVDYRPSCPAKSDGTPGETVNERGYCSLRFDAPAPTEANRSNGR